MMLASRVRNLSSSLLRNSSNVRSQLSQQSPRSLSSGAASHAALTPQEQVFYEQGILDERGLTVFSTLHDMQVNSCQVYAGKKLFGTYGEASKQFEWMTFQDYAHRVDQCRAMLKNLGESKLTFASK
jgi:hypothetical protein